jgi:hypothetical protein
MVSPSMLRRVVLVKTDVSEESSASFIRVTRVGELGTTLAVVSYSYVPPKRRLLQEPHGVTSQKTQFFRKTWVCCSYKVDNKSIAENLVGAL